MRVAINQPYFFPYAGYFALIRNSDLFIAFDGSQFTKQGWMKRNRILNPVEGWEYVGVPVLKHRQKTPINEIEIDNSKDWGTSILSQIGHYKRKAPYYTTVRELLQDTFAQNWTHLAELNVYTLRTICAYVGIGTPIKVYSSLGLNVPQPQAADEWALHICQALGNVKEYVNPPGGKGFYDTQKYTNAGIPLHFIRMNTVQYDQGREPFEPDLSILDFLMFNDPRAVHEMLGQYEWI